MHLAGLCILSPPAPPILFVESSVLSMTWYTPVQSGNYWCEWQRHKDYGSWRIDGADHRLRDEGSLRAGTGPPGKHVQDLSHSRSQSQRIGDKTELPLPVVYEGVRLDAGYRLDVLVENTVVLELKAEKQTQDGSTRRTGGTGERPEPR
jgi:hypothetical protein